MITAEIFTRTIVAELALNAKNAAFRRRKPRSLKFACERSYLSLLLLGVSITMLFSSNVVDVAR